MNWIKPAGGGPYDWQLSDPQAVASDVYSLKFVDSNCNVTTVVANSAAQNIPLYQRLGDNFCLEDGKLLVVPSDNIIKRILKKRIKKEKRIKRKGYSSFFLAK